MLFVGEFPLQLTWPSHTILGARLPRLTLGPFRPAPPPARPAEAPNTVVVRVQHALAGAASLAASVLVEPWEAVGGGGGVQPLVVEVPLPAAGFCTTGQGGPGWPLAGQRYALAISGRSAGGGEGPPTVLWWDPPPVRSTPRRPWHSNDMSKRLLPACS